MSKTKQLLALITFIQLTNPTVWVIFILFAIQYWFLSHHSLPNYTPSLDLLLVSQNTFVAMIFGAVVILPEVFSVGAKNANLSGQTDYLLTRAVDRYMVLRARSLLVYALVILVPLFALANGLFHPNIQVHSYDQATRTAIVATFPNIEVHKESYHESYLLPHGNILLASWSLLKGLLTVAGMQVVLLLLAKAPFRMFLIYGIFFIFLFVPTFLLPESISKSESVSPTVWAFLQFAQNPWLWTLGIIALVIAAQKWCEYRFRTIDF